MKEQKNIDQRLYKVRIYKDFEFPSFSINQSNRLQDLCHKSLEEVEENFHKGEEYFKIEIIQELPFLFNVKTEELPLERFNFDINFFIREIAIKDVEDKYGKLDVSTNPDIFDKKVRNTGALGNYDAPYNVKEEVGTYYSERVRHYCKTIEDKI